MIQTDNLRITNTRPLIAPVVLQREIPLSQNASALVASARQSIRDILTGEDPRLLLVVGPCSIHDTDAAVDYAQRLKQLADGVANKILVVMRVYFEKPRTVIGWKGLLNDPDLDSSFNINKGLRLARQLLADIASIGLPAGTEFLDTTFGQYYTDLISWGAIGARTAESQIHRELASGLSMPIGIKNRTDGNIQIAIDAIRTAGHSHLFPSLTKEGAPAILETSGNPDCHLVLRGGEQPNYHEQDINRALDALSQADLPQRVMIDCSHANSQKNPDLQIVVAQDVCATRQHCPAVRALMIESFIEAGRQNPGASLRYGQSITDACLGFTDTQRLVLGLAEH